MKIRELARHWEHNAKGRLTHNNIQIRLDLESAARLAALSEMYPKRQPQELLLEATYADPNGEVQTIRNVANLWPAGVIAGIKTEGWVSTSQQIKFQALALDLSGKPQEGVALEVKATARITTTTRKRMVGGFYTYDNKTSTKEMGSVCSGKSDSRGLLLCETSLGEPGEVELVVTAKDASGNSIQAASSVYVTKQGELWFGGENHDRIDLLPEKKSYQPGETAKFQVRMPFRFATALVAVAQKLQALVRQSDTVARLGGDEFIVMLQSLGPDLAHAAAQALTKAKRKAFDPQGGIGFDPRRPPIDDCPECFGRGQGRTIVHDTRNLSPAAASLYAGVKQTKDGLQVLMHDQAAARDRLERHLGVFEKDNRQKNDLAAQLAEFVGGIHQSGAGRLMPKARAAK